MTLKKSGGFFFVTYSGDHGPKHVHIYKDRKLVGKFDIDHQIFLGNLEMSKRLRKALKELEYIKKK